MFRLVFLFLFLSHFLFLQQLFKLAMVEAGADRKLPHRAVVARHFREGGLLPIRREGLDGHHLPPPPV